MMTSLDLNVIISIVYINFCKYSSCIYTLNHLINQQMKILVYYQYDIEFTVIHIER